MLAIEWNGIKNRIPALEYVTTPTLAIEWDGWVTKSDGGDQTYQPPMIEEVTNVNIESCKQSNKNGGIQNVENVVVKKVVVEKAQHVVVKNVVSVQGTKTVRVKRKVWTKKKNGLFGWIYKLDTQTIKTSNSELERAPPLEPVIMKLDCSSQLIQTGHQSEKRKFSGRAATFLEGESENYGLEGGEVKTKRLKLHDIL